MEDINIREISENENLKKVANIVEKILNFNEQQKRQMTEYTNSQTNTSNITNSNCTSKNR